ncbi:N-formylglutamate amidohydrolase [Aquibaculum sediminis]|uniref:N-formylglutamate amidohydrolase n=1 Tax=Aquibaculum sediminis TaxID=3231907 RepID=UPI0034538A59
MCSDAIPSTLLGPSDPPPVGELAGAGDSPFFLVCDHAGNAVPASLEGLGLPQAERERHIAIDRGALAVAKNLAARLQAPLVYQRYSRLVIDCNRKPEAGDSIPAVADATEVPANQDLDPVARQARHDAILKPYHDRIRALLDARAEAGLPTLFVSVHSFTPELRARPLERPWDLGLCWGDDRRFNDLVLAALEEQTTDLRLGRNEPYGVDMENDYSIPVHAEARGLPYVEFEMRQDHLEDAAAPERWAERLEGALRLAAERFLKQKG